MKTMTIEKFKEKVEKRENNHCVFESSELDIDVTPDILGQDRPLLEFNHCHLKNCTFDSMKITHFNNCELNHVTFKNCSFGIEVELFEFCRLEIVDFDSCTFHDNDIVLSYLIGVLFYKCTFEKETIFKSSIIYITKFAECENTNALNFENCHMGSISIDGKMQRFVTIDGIGSRRAITTYNITQDNVKCGCWSTIGIRGGSLADFEARVNNTYPSEGSGLHRKEYMNAIELFKMEREWYKNE